MKPRLRDPLRLDVEAFAKDGGRLEGRWPLSGFDRLIASAHPERPPGPGDEVTWQAEAELRPVRGGAGQVWLHLTGEARLALECQRCLRPVPETLAVRRSFLFVPDEATAAQADADSEDDVLVLTRALNIHELLEDELILALPLVPRHVACPEPLAAPAGAEPESEQRPNPFAALAALKRGGPH